MSQEEIVLPHVGPRDQVPLASGVRGTVIIASLRGIRRFGHGDRYLRALDPRYHDLVASLTAATWLPMDFALAHYGACDQLALDRDTIEKIGAESGRVINETMLTVLSKLSTESGVTPWFTLGNGQKLIGRTWIGSSFGVWRVGPKEARIEWIRQPVAQFPYFRVAFGAFLVAICEIFAQTMYWRETPRRLGHQDEAGYRLSWV